MTQRVLIVGGGVMGAATACFLARDFGVCATVVERDPTYRLASSARSASSIRQQFSTEINVRISQRSIAFLRRVGEELAADGDRPEIGLREPGYLFLADDAGAAALRANHALQTCCGASVALLDAAALQARFPWLAVHDVAAGTLGLSGEGWFDGYALLQAFRRKATSLGARFVRGDVCELAESPGRVSARTREGERFVADVALIAAGAWSAPLAAQVGFTLPVSARKRDVFVFESPARLQSCPLLIDPGGVWFRPEGRGFIAGAPPRGPDVPGASLDEIDHGLFEHVIWPTLAARVPQFEAARPVGAWAGYYEYNEVDQNGLVGRLPGRERVFVACGFSGHGIQQAPAIGRGMAELIATGSFLDLDLSVLSPQRLVQAGPRAEEQRVI